ncbi:MAG: DUF4398 and OmpA-like domain-containing protein [Pseudomonadota bacterium]|nr:MAG: DUF4398 and OmpA-like domain-containing protein [Pseudomonadota bacterium]
MNNQLLIRLGMVLALVLGLSNCAGTPEKSEVLEKARAAYQSAAADNVVTKYAPLALKQAEESLRAAEDFWKGGGGKTEVDHRAYLAQQKVAIAVERAKLNAAEAEVQQARMERDRVLLEARVHEVEAARRLAEARAREAEAARRKAEILAKELSDLQARGTERGMVLTLGDVLFDFDRADLKPGGQRVAQRLADFLKRHAERNVMIEGFTDSVGDADYNQRLSQRRANAVRAALLNNGIEERRIQVFGYGKAYPVASNATESGRQQNRRVEVVISDADGKIRSRE